ncbi:MAG TPA: DNA-3-methyladenine glycosylase I [Pseudomonadales bacterium]|nr:DNA-3-methyladenine glycosylase I [Pseudomonadales bacterium]
MPQAHRRCGWCGEDPLYVAYHDDEWGRPCRDESRLFEFLLLESMQAGLSWLTILRKRENFRAAFSGFDAEVIARYTDADRARLLADAGIVRNRAKVDATIGNARAVLALREAGGGLSALLWSTVDGRPVQNRFRTLAEVPASTALATSLSKRLKAAGFRFVGPTICYALMQATGMVNDHLLDCPARAPCAALADD